MKVFVYSVRTGAVLINTSRGAVINTNDLLLSLESGRLGAACLDVYEFEKGLFFDDHGNRIIHDKTFARLRSFNNVLVTSHQGFLTSEAIKQIAETTIGVFKTGCHAETSWERNLSGSQRQKRR